MASFTSATTGADIRVYAKGEVVTVALSGTYVASTRLEKAVDSSLQAWTVVEEAGPWTTDDATVSYSLVTTEDFSAYRLNVYSYTSGTLVGTITEGDKIVDLDPDGNYTRTDAGLTEHGTLTVDGATVLSGTTLHSGAVTTTVADVTVFGLGAKNGATITAVENGDSVVHRTTLTCTATPITMADDAAVAQYGGVKVYDFPLGAICILGAVCDGDFTAIEPWLDTWTGDMALGSATATTGATLVGTEADMLQSCAIGTATALVAAIDASLPVATALTESGARWFDGTNTAKDMYLNVIADDDDGNTATTAAITFTGTISFVWINLGVIAA